MAVQKVKARKQSQLTLPLVEKQLILPLFLTIAGKQFFEGALNDTVMLKVKDGSIATARQFDFRGRTGPIVLDDIYQTGGQLPVRLDTHIYSATGLEDEHFTLDDIDFAADVLSPQVEAVVDQIEARALTGVRSAHAKHTVGFNALEDDPHLVATESKRLMDSDKTVPYNGRIFVVGNDIGAAWRASSRLSEANLADTVAPAVRDAVIGRLSGSLVIEHNGLNADEGYYMHGTSFILGSVAPDVPRGAVTGNSNVGRRGLAVRWIQDYDANYLRDRSIVSSFMGMNEVRDERDADGNWIVEEGEFLADQLAVMRNRDGSEVEPVAVGTRKNVRIVKLNPTNTGAVFTPTA